MHACRTHHFPPSPPSWVRPHRPTCASCYRARPSFLPCLRWSYTHEEMAITEHACLLINHLTLHSRWHVVRSMKEHKGKGELHARTLFLCRSLGLRCAWIGDRCRPMPPPPQRPPLDACCLCVAGCDSGVGGSMMRGQGIVLRGRDARTTRVFEWTRRFVVSCLVFARRPRSA